MQPRKSGSDRKIGRQDFGQVERESEAREFWSRAFDKYSSSCSPYSVGSRDRPAVKWRLSSNRFSSYYSIGNRPRVEMVGRHDDLIG